MADLRTSRERILEAADAERRRIERDLHDGAQQRMVAVAVTLGLAQAQMESNPQGAAQLIQQAREEAQLAVKELRELARGIHPAVLSDHGLEAALEALATRAPVPVDVSGVPEEPLPRAVEAAVYFVTAEVLTNVAKYAHADCASVNLAVDDGSVFLQITDDGVGGAEVSGGTGLSGLCDRVEALDGTIDIESPPGGGTAVRVQIPLRP
ncbi:MAG TPA: sensor histidine kinase [Solirubrobacteraceae bacterium]|nr:sensor histidine kinase [Solirubrobacteraceae bacterium]